MKTLKLATAGVLFVGVILGCAMIFGPNKNKITDWVAAYSEGTVYTLQYRYVDNDPYWADYQFNETLRLEVVDVNERDTRTTVRFLLEGAILSQPMTFYLIASETTGRLLISLDDIASNDDGILLATPVEDGNAWFGSSMFMSYGLFSDVRSSIYSTKTSREVGIETANDVVEIRTELSAVDDEVVSARAFFSPKHGWLGDRVELSDGTYRWSYEMSVIDIDRK